MIVGWVTPVPDETMKQNAWKNQQGRAAPANRLDEPVERG